MDVDGLTVSKQAQEALCCLVCGLNSIEIELNSIPEKLFCACRAKVSKLTAKRKSLPPTSCLLAFQESVDAC